MTLTTRVFLAGAIGVLVFPLAACGSDDEGVGASNGDDSSPTASATPAQTSGATAAPQSPSPDDEPTASGGDSSDENTAEPGGGGGENYVQVGDERFVADNVQCAENDGGMEIVGAVTDSVQIGGVFGVGDPEDPPDMVFVLIDAGAGGQWTAMSEVQGFSIGSLDELNVSDGASASGEGTFALQDGASVTGEEHPGDFSFTCP